MILQERLFPGMTIPAAKAYHFSTIMSMDRATRDALLLRPTITRIPLYFVDGK
jgi:hypothetical protein